MWRKTVVVVALASSIGAVELRSFVPRGSGPHCTDQICACPRHPPPKAQATAHCHGDQGRSSSTEMSAACHHEDPAAPTPVRPRILPAAAALIPPGFSDSSAPSLRSSAAPGHLRHELPPPRSAA